jgi:hypothetical protein
MRKSGETPELAAKLKQHMQEFVQNSLNERQARLARLRDVVKREEDGLAKDRADTAALEQKQRERFERDMKRMVDFSIDGELRPPTTEPARSQ